MEKRIIQVEEKFETAVETALGGNIQNIVTEEELEGILNCRDQVQVIVTGKVLPEGIRRIADKVEYVDCSNCSRYV